MNTSGFVINTSVNYILHYLLYTFKPVLDNVTGTLYYHLREQVQFVSISSGVLSVTVRGLKRGLLFHMAAQVEKADLSRCCHAGSPYGWSKSFPLLLS